VRYPSHELAKEGHAGLRRRAFVDQPQDLQVFVIHASQDVTP
jgi:hypothetical protein